MQCGSVTHSRNYQIGVCLGARASFSIEGGACLARSPVRTRATAFSPKGVTPRTPEPSETETAATSHEAEIGKIGNRAPTGVD